MAVLRGDSPIQYVKGVGPAIAGRFASIDIHTVADLLAYYPFRYEQDQGETEIADLRPGVTATVQGQIVDIGGRYPGLAVRIDDGSGDCLLRWFNRQHGPRGLGMGATVVATGKVKEYNYDLEMIQPSVRVFEPDAVLLSPDAERGKLVGVYRATADIKPLTIRRTVQTILATGRLPIDEILPVGVLKKRALPDKADAVHQMHQPKDEDAAEAARRRLAYEEFFVLELAMALRRYKTAALRKAYKVFVTSEVDRRVRARFPFQLTAAQDKAIREISHDLESGREMTRLLQGDVGSGKTVVALYACLAAIANGRQAAIMAPTEILAQQHFANIESYLEGSRVRRTLLRGKLPKKERAATLAAIEAGEIDLVVGTQALLERDVAFNALTMVVVDEQHKFGVVQRSRIRTKGPLPHFLVMTATPIPRTLAMTVFGDLDVSTIDALPPGRGKIITKVVGRGQRATVLEYVRKRLEAGEQAYVVCPLIGKDDEKPDSPATTDPSLITNDRSADLISATKTHNRLTNGAWRGLNVGLLHGVLKPNDKHAVVEAFLRGELHAVVSTTVVEVGVDVANATIMIIENADRFGLSQLHQLRGRVGRGSKDSLCVLIPQRHGKKVRERTEVMTQTNDGFKIAEADLRLRGPGELLGTRQHGLPELRVGHLVDDFDLLEQAREDAFEIIRNDPALKKPEHGRLLPALRRAFGEKLKFVDAG